MGEAGARARAHGRGEGGGERAPSARAPRGGAAARAATAPPAPPPRNEPGSTCGAPTRARLSAEQVKKPVTPLSLRVSGHLLLGLSRIFAKKVAYLAADASEVITKLKTVRGCKRGLAA